MKRNMLLLAAVVSMAAITAAAGGFFAKNSLGAVANGCVAGVPKMGPSPSFSVTLSKHQCYKSGRAIPTGVSYVYKQLDYGESACGSVVSNRGPAFTPRLNTTYYVLADFTVRPLKTTVGVKSKSTGWTRLQMGRWQLQCGRYPSVMPSRSDVCGINPDAQRGDGSYECEYRVDDPAYASKSLPRFGGMPMQLGNAVYPPKLIMPSGTCTERIIFRSHLMGVQNNVASWSCPDHMLVDTELIIYYFPPGSSSVCVGPHVTSSNPYTVGPQTTVPDERFTRVQLPQAASNWGGHAQFVFHETVHPKDGTLQVNGAPLTIAEQWSNLDVQFPGTANGCAQMTQFNV